MNGVREPDSSGQVRGGTARTGLKDVADLFVVTLLTGLVLGMGVVYGPQGGPRLLRVPLGLLFVFLLPGYALTAAMFPGKDCRASEDDGGFSITVTERLVLSVGLSLVVVPLVGLGVTFVSQQLSVGIVLGGVGLFILSSSTIATARRFRLPPGDRFRAVPRASLRRGVEFATGNYVNLFLVTTLAFSLGGLGIALASSGGEERYTELSLLGTAGSVETGTAVYPTEFEAGESQSLVVEVANQERSELEYTVVVMLQQLSDDAEMRTVTQSEQLDEMTISLTDGQRERLTHEIQPSVTGERLQLVYLLYLGESPDNPTVSNAYRTVHLSVDVTD